MFKRIVVGTDGSGGAQEAVARSAELASATGATLHIVLAYKDLSETAALLAAEPTIGSALAGALPDGAALKKAASHALESASRVAAGVEHQLHARAGDPAEILIGVADEVDADLIVVGNRGMKGARRILGSVPNTVAHAATRPVMILPTT